MSGTMEELRAEAQEHQRRENRSLWGLRLAFGRHTAQGAQNGLRGCQGVVVKECEVKAAGEGAKHRFVCSLPKGHEGDCGSSLECGSVRHPGLFFALPVSRTERRKMSRKVEKANRRKQKAAA